MATSSTAERPIEVGIFDSVELADPAVAGLLKAGFTVDQITVVSLDETKERYFRKYEHQEPAGTGISITGGGRRCDWCLVGGLTARSDRRSDRWFGNTGGRPPGRRRRRRGGWIHRARWCCAVWEKELADYYQQAVIEGRILVAAEDTGPSCAAVVGAGGRDPGRGWCQSAAHAGRLDI